MILSNLVLLLVTSAEAQRECETVVKACRAAGFQYGRYPQGYGMNLQCINPLMQGYKQNEIPGIKKTLPVRTAALENAISECHRKNRQFGSGSIGLPGNHPTTSATPTSTGSTSTTTSSTSTSTTTTTTTTETTTPTNTNTLPPPEPTDGPTVKGCCPERQFVCPPVSAFGPSGDVFVFPNPYCGQCVVSNNGESSPYVLSTCGENTSCCTCWC